jgi:hypothetical protein
MTDQGLVRLLADDPVAAYWVGFIFADGSLSEWRLRVCLSVKDADHLRKLASWFGPGFAVRSERAGTVVSLARQDRVAVPAIRSRFDLRPRKTYEPPAFLPYHSETLLRCWLVGYIDGDGEVRRQTGRPNALLHTVAHLSWEPLLTEMSETLGFGLIRRRVVQEQAYVALTCHRHSEIVALRQFARTQELPVLERKWAKVDETYVAPDPKDGRMRARVEVLARQGMRVKDIAAELGCSIKHASETRKALGFPDARLTTTSTQDGGRYG